MRRKVNNRWIYAHLGTVRWIKNHGKWAWLLYPLLYLSMRFFLFAFDFAARAQARILKNKGGEVEN